MSGGLLFWVGLSSVAVIYGGYAAWVLALASLRPVPVRRPRPADRLPDVTCVIAAADEGGTIDRKLESLRRQDYPRARLSFLVVSDGSTDATDAEVAAHAAADPCVRLLRLPTPSGKPSALNLARAHTTSEVMVCMDARQEVAPDAIRKLVARLADPAVGVVSGDLRVRGDSYWRLERSLRRAESRSGSMVQVTGALYALRTADFPSLPADLILDDVYVPLTVALSGRRIVLAEDAVGDDTAPATLSGELGRKIRTLAGLVQVCHRLPAALNPTVNPVWGRFLVHKLARLLCPYGLVLAAVGAAAGAGPGPLPWLSVAAFGLFAAAGVAGVRSRLTNACRSLVTLHLAALAAVPAYYLGLVSVRWRRPRPQRAAPRRPDAATRRPELAGGSGQNSG